MVLSFRLSVFLFLCILEGGSRIIPSFLSPTAPTARKRKVKEPGQFTNKNNFSVALALLGVDLELCVCLYVTKVTMADRALLRACKDPSPIIDGRKANVNLAYLGAKTKDHATR